MLIKGTYKPSKNDAKPLESVIDRETWEAAQKKIQENNKPTPPRGYRWAGDKLVAYEPEVKIISAVFNEYTKRQEIENGGK